MFFCYRLYILPPDSTQRLFVVDEIGKIRIVDECGLLGLAFHPQFKTNGKFYVFYTAPPRPGTPVPGAPGSTWNSLTTVSEFTVSPSDPNTANMSSERFLIQADHPSLNHNAGTLAFGPDGFLYISIGDGGNMDDVGNGLVSDWYTVNAGGNYGWNVKEGTHCFDTDSDLLERPSCPSVDSSGKALIDPVIELVNTANPKGGGVGIAIIGGFAYRGSALPKLQGVYIFGVLSQSGKADGQVFASMPATSGMWTWSEGVEEFYAEFRNVPEELWPGPERGNVPDDE